MHQKSRHSTGAYSVGVRFMPVVLILLWYSGPSVSQNLLTNPSGETGDMTGWTIIANGATGWGVIESEDQANLHGGQDGCYVFKTDHEWCKRSQTINLVARGYTTTQLDAAPAIVATEWFRGYSRKAPPNFSDTAYLKVELRRGDGSVITSYNSGNFTTSDAWVQKGKTFTGYGAGLRYIYWEDGGDGAENWNAYDGPVLDAAKLTIGVTKPTPEISVSPTTLSFGTISLPGGTTNAVPITIRNLGTANLEVSYCICDGAVADYAIVGSPSTAPIAPGATRIVEVAFNPIQPDSRPATMRVWSNDSDEPTTEITLTGAGTAQPTCMSIVRAAATPTAASSLSFTVTFSTSVTGVDTADFKIDASGVTGASVSGVSGSGTTWTVTTATGSGTGTLSIDLIDNDSILAGTTPLGGAGTGNGNFTIGESYYIDRTRPVITILGSNPAEVVRGATYVDAGATATDNLDGNITSRIVKGGSVDTSTIGSYQITYNVTDLLGNAAIQAVRTVNVVFGPTQTFYVDIANAGAENGSSTYPFDTIAEGIAAAENGRGDSVVVRPGVYHEHITLKSKLILVGERGSYHTEITGDGASQDVVAMGSDSVMRGFTISHSGTKAGVRVPSSLTATVKNCVIHSCAIGLRAYTGATVAFVNNTVYLNTTYGVRGEPGAKFSPLRNNIFASNATALSADAAAIVGGSYNCLYNNTTAFSGPPLASTDFTANPRFVSAGTGNFHLDYLSPCRDKGDPATQYKDIDGSRNDIGTDGGPTGVRDTLAPTAVATASHSSGEAPLTVNFNGSGSSDEWGIASYSWDFDASNGIQQDAAGATTSRTFTTAKTYLVTLTVADNNGLTAKTTKTVTVSQTGNTPPTASASVTPLAGPVPLAVNFTGTGSDPDGGAVTYSWDFTSNGSQDSTSQNPSYTYPSGTVPGSLRATLTVKDNENTTTQAYAYVTVTQEEPEVAVKINPAASTLAEVNAAASPIDGASVSVPAGALANPLILTLGSVPEGSAPAPPESSASVVAEVGPAGVNLSNPATVTLPLTFVPLKPDQLGAAYYDAGAGKWTSVGISNVQYLGTPPDVFLAFDVTHFSFFVATYPAASPDINQDGFINSIDIQICINAVLGMPLSQPYRTDISGDGRTNSIDLQTVIVAVLNA